jgi:hypothetical protein
MSIVVQVLNEEKLIKQVPAVLTSWSVPDVIVVDGGSSNRTVTLAARSAKVVVTSPPRAAQPNASAREAKGDTPWFVHVNTTPI